MDLGFNPAWWIAIAFALGLAGIGFLINEPPHSYIGWRFIVASGFALTAGVISIGAQRGWALQSPLVLSAHKLGNGSFPARPMLVSGLLIAEMLVVGIIIGGIVFSRRSIATQSEIASQPTVPTQSWLEEYQKQRDERRRAERAIPKPFSESDALLLIRELTPLNIVVTNFRFQIFREDDDGCKLFAESLSNILKRARWTEVAPISTPAPGFAMPLGITIRSSTLDPASATGNRLVVKLRDLGIYTDWQAVPELREYDFAMIYISDRGYLPKD